MKKSTRRSAPKSQSEKAAEKKSRALTRAGTAVIDGMPEKAKKILAAQKKRETKKPSTRQAVEILTEAHTIESQLTALDHEIEGVKEHYKELKSRREMLVVKLRSEVRDMGQGRLPFQSGPLNEPKSKKDAKPASSVKDGAVDAPAESKGDPLDDELTGSAELDQMEAAGEDRAPAAKRESA